MQHRDPLALATALRDALPVARLTEADLQALLDHLDAAARMARQRLTTLRREQQQAWREGRARG